MPHASEERRLYRRSGAGKGREIEPAEEIG